MRKGIRARQPSRFQSLFHHEVLQHFGLELGFSKSCSECHVDITALEKAYLCLAPELSLLLKGFSKLLLLLFS